MSEGGFLSHEEDGTKKGAAESNRKWHEELAKADERGNRFRLQVEEVQKRKAEVEDKLTQFEKQVHIRDEEIKRLHNLYQGGANLEALSVKHTHETNERTIGKLANQVEFLNKENHQLQQQLLVLRGDTKTIKTLDRYEAEIRELEFEVSNLKKDKEQYQKIIREYEERETVNAHRTEELSNQEQILAVKLEDRLKELQGERDTLRAEQERMNQVRAAYNADKRALVERVQELESALRQRDFDRQETEAKVTLLEQSAQNYRNEINFWNGKCSNLRRDVEYQERHLARYKDENSKLMNECDYLKVRSENLDREVHLLRRQVSGL